MATKFMTLEKGKPKPKVQTTFESMVMGNGNTDAAYSLCPDDYENVMFLWKDKSYGDVFVAWDDDNDNDRTIFFGNKGDEFDNQ